MIEPPTWTPQQRPESLEVWNNHDICGRRIRSVIDDRSNYVTQHKVDLKWPGNDGFFARNGQVDIETTFRQLRQ